MITAFGVRNPVYRVTRLENGRRVPITEVPDGTELGIVRMFIEDGELIIELSATLPPTVIRTELSDTRGAYGAVYVRTADVPGFGLTAYRAIAGTLRREGYEGQITARRVSSGGISVKRWRK